MTQLNIFTPEERLAVRRSLLFLCRDAVRLDLQRLRAIRDFLRREVEQGAALRDALGQNRILVALETLVLSAEEIGLHDSLTEAFVLQSLEMTPDREARAAAFCTPEGRTALDVMCRLAAMEVKDEALRTDNFRGFFVSQAGDMRIVLLLIARSVVLLRRIKESPNDVARREAAMHAAALYAPLAHKLGLYRMKSELEDLSLKYLEHDAYYLIKERLNATKRTRDAYIERFIAPIREMLDAEHFKYYMKGRTKSIHSIWQKMKKQGCGFEGVYDLFAIRIILDVPLEMEKEACWKVFSLITNRYDSNLSRLRDWLSVPKSNGYESLHITVRGPENKWVEVQIRSARMDDIAEHGLAAHWRYKGVKATEGGVENWLADIRVALETGNERLLSESFKTKGGNDEVYVFTPKGDLYKLPHGATVLDFAYNIHSAVGNHCVGGRVTGRNVPIRQRLVSGEMVEIMTSVTQTPKAEWLSIVVSPHAKAKIRAAVRELSARNGAIGREQLERKLKNRKIEWDESLVNQLIKKLGYRESSEFFRDIAEDRLEVGALTAQYLELAKREAGTGERIAARSAEEFNFEKEQERHSAEAEDVMLIDHGVKGIDFQMARCCNPLYGDDVFAFVTSGGGVKIHRTSCPNAAAMRSRFGYRILPARWAGKGSGKYSITLHVVGQDDMGIVNNITSIISKEEHINLRSINIDSNDGLFYGTLTVMLDDTDRLNSLIKKLRTVKGVKAVSR